jgi:hypothetical protein
LQEAYAGDSELLELVSRLKERDLPGFQRFVSGFFASMRFSPSSAMMMDLARRMDKAEFDAFVASFCRSLNYSPPASHTLEHIRRAAALASMPMMDVADVLETVVAGFRSDVASYNSQRGQGMAARLGVKRKAGEEEDGGWRGTIVQEGDVLWTQSLSAAVGTATKSETMLAAVLRLWRAVFDRVQGKEHREALRKKLVERIGYDANEDLLSASEANVFHLPDRDCAVSALEFLRKGFIPAMVHASMRGTKWVRQAIVSSDGSLWTATMQHAVSKQDKDLVTELNHLKTAWESAFGASETRWKITAMPARARKQLLGQFTPPAYTLVRLGVHLEKLVARGMRLFPGEMPVGLAQLVNAAACWRFWTSVVTRPGQLATLRASGVGMKSLFERCLMVVDNDRYSLLVTVSKTVKGETTNFQFGAEASALFALLESKARPAVLKAYGRQHDGFFVTNTGQSLSPLLDLPADATTAEIEKARNAGRHRIDAVLGGVEAIVEDLLGCDSRELMGSLTSHNGIRSAFFTDRDDPGQLLDLCGRGIAHRKRKLLDGQRLDVRLRPRDGTPFDLPPAEADEVMTVAQREECKRALNRAAHSSQAAKAASYDENMLLGSLFVADRLEAAREYVASRVDEVVGEEQVLHNSLSDEGLRIALSVPLRNVPKRILGKDSWE